MQQKIKALNLIKSSKFSAFTLIELLVVIAIVGILSGVIMMSASNATNSANDAKRKVDLDTIRKALLMYQAANGGIYPIQTTTCNIGTNCNSTEFSNLISTYLPNPPRDPNGTDYTYISDATGSIFTLSSILSSSLKYSYNSATGFCPPVTFMYNGSSVTYGSVVSPTGKCWMDRNLGATQIATSSTDSAAYGDLFQWGRLADGHQLINRTTSTPINGSTSTLATTDIPGNSLFITSGAPPYDWRSPQGTGCSSNSCLWQGVTGINNPCPSGWRIPTWTEWATEMSIWDTSPDYRTKAYNSVLKLTAAGCRSRSVASLVSIGSDGYYWSSTVGGPSAADLNFNASDAGQNGDFRAYGFSVRCLRD